jgi:hypothetical protein
MRGVRRRVWIGDGGFVGLWVFLWWIAVVGLHFTVVYDFFYFFYFTLFQTL